MAAPAVDDDAVIKERLLTRTAIIGRPSPLRVLTAKFHAFLDALDNGKATDSSEAEVLYEQLLKELTTFEFMNSKYHTMRSASARERRSVAATAVADRLWMALAVHGHNSWQRYAGIIASNSWRCKRRLAPRK
eukprot:scaffold795_cov375-Prasinococcus_capsulatus_cf.AAC.30